MSMNPPPSRRSVRRFLLSSALLAGLSSPAALAQETVFVARDGHGVAHVQGSTDAGAFYGAGFAHAEDRLFQMCLQRAMFEGRIAEFLGAGPPGGGNAYVELDVYHRRLGWTRHAALEAAHLPAEEAGLMDAFVQGINDYMALVRSGARPEHPLFAATGLPLDEDWTVADSLGLWLQLGSRFRPIQWDEPKLRAEIEYRQGLGQPESQIIDALFGGKCDDDAAVVQTQHVDTARYDAMVAYATAKGLSTATNCNGGVLPPPPHFSHTWAVASSKVTEGLAVLMADPRLSITIPNTLYEWHMRGATFDARGAGAPGVPYFLVGSNGAVAWGGSALGGDQSDLFLMDVDLTTVPATYTIDLLDGAGPVSLPMVERRTDVDVAGGSPVPVIYRETVFGPLVTEYVQLHPQQPPLGPTDAYALKALPWSHSGSSNVTGYLAMMRAGDADAFRLALGGQLFPSINIVFADGTGRVGYVANGGFPVRQAGDVFAGFAAMDGTTLASDWQELLPHDFKPWLIDPPEGFVLSANHQPAASFWPLPFVSSVLGETTRSWRLRQLLDVPGTQTVNEIYAMHLSAELPQSVGLTEVAEAIVAQVDPLFPADPQAQLALGHLSAWLAAGGEMTNAHPATALAAEVEFRFPKEDDGSTLGVAVTYGGKGVIPFLKVKLAELELGTFTATADEQRAVELMLRDAYDRVLDENGQDPDPLVWQAHYQAAKLDQVYTLADDKLGQAPWTVVDSYPLASGGSQGVVVRWDTNLPVFTHGQPRATEGGTLMEQAGQSFTQMVLPGFADGALSQLTPGVREWMTPGTPLDISGSGSPTNGRPIDENQESLWSAPGSGATFDLKWSPTTASGITNLTGGFLSVEQLSFTPAP